MDKVNNQILFQGTVVDNVDPRMLNRIRVQVHGIDDKIPNGWNEKDKWTSKDPIVFLPLLPIFFNQTPLVDELVTVMYQNKDFKNQNQFYLQGPFSSPMSLPFEHHQGAKVNLASGDRNKESLSVKNPDGTYPVSKSVGVFPEPEDNAILGRGAADIIIKKDDVLIRAGKTKKLTPVEQPEGNVNRAFLQLSNFTQKRTPQETESQSTLEEQVDMVKKMIVWNINNLENKADVFNGSVSLCNVIRSEKVNTKNFKFDTILDLSVGTNYGNPVEEIIFTAMSFNDIIQAIKNFMNAVLTGKKSYLPSDYVVKDEQNFLETNVFPFVVTPGKQTYETGRKFTPNLTNIDKDITEFTNYERFSYAIKINEANKQHGWFLVSGHNNDKPVLGPQTKSVIQKVTPIDIANEDISYGVLGSQRVYILSQDSAGPKGPISLGNTLYGIPQEKFIGDENSIFSKTYPSVRGDKMIELLRKIFAFTANHVHPCAGKEPDTTTLNVGITVDEINSLLADAENTVLNQNIRIN
jgi:hypothetical protein